MATGYAIGIDFGTASARTLLLDLSSGEEAAVSEQAYEHGVIDTELPSSGARLPMDWALHDPGDYMAALEAGVKDVLAQHPAAGSQIVGIGLDATSCTVLPVDASGLPLCKLPLWANRPHAWPKLWKHHAAQPVANRLNEVAEERGEKWLARYGGRISSEWYFPKLIELWLEDRDVYDATAAFIEITDWVVWQLSGKERRSACPASYKALWSPDEGIPRAEFFEAAYPGFSRPTEKLGETFYPLGTSAGQLLPEMAARLGLPETVAVAVGNVDSFVSFPGSGAEGAGKWVMVVGTSICDMVVHAEQVLLSGITGVARDGILPGLYGYEAGQPAVGDMLAWFATALAGATHLAGATTPGATTPGATTPGATHLAGATTPGATHLAGATTPGAITTPGMIASTGATALAGGATPAGAGSPELLSNLERAAATVPPGSTGLVALDWWNGNRSVLADADLSGVIAGLTLQSTPVEIYRALMESIAFGNRVVLDNFRDNGFAVDEIVACGGIAEKSPLTMQLFADVSGLPVSVTASQQVPARGSALFGAVAAGQGAGGFRTISEACAVLTPGISRTYKPDPSAAGTYEAVYAVWKGLHDTLGRKETALLHELKRLKRDNAPDGTNH